MPYIPSEAEISFNTQTNKTELFHATGLEQLVFDLFHPVANEESISAYRELVDRFIDEMGETDAYWAITYLDDCGYDSDSILERVEEVQIFDGTAEEYARYYVDEVEELPDLDDSFLAAYWIFDYEAFVKDLIDDQDIVEIAHDLWVTNNLDF